MNIDAVPTNKLEKSEEIFNLNDPKTPIQALPDHSNRGVVEDLQNAINEMGSISVSASAQKEVAVESPASVIKVATVERKEYDLIEQMKTELDANI